MARQPNKIHVEMDIEPPYTLYATLTFAGAKDNGIAVTSKTVKLINNTQITVGESGGIAVGLVKKSKKKEDKEN